MTVAKAAPSKTAEEALTEHEEAAQRRAQAAKNPEALDPRTRQLLDALAAERRGYVMRGRHDRVAAVDEQIKSLES